MRLNLTIICLLLLTSSVVFGQNTYGVKGAAVDTEQFLKLYNSSVSILNAKDSLLRRFTRATNDGSFTLSGLPAGNYFILVTYPEYADYVEKFTLDAAHPVHNFGNINLRLKEKVLKEVMIKGEVRAIKINGDTTEFNAKAYVIQPNDKVEDLLKQMPGMQIDKDGKITVNGQAVQKVLVDGEEFFGDDPTLVTKNLRADMVDKVQLYDKKSDQAAFTGVDDGQKIKTLNVVLKEDKKKGTFGKVLAGGGTDQYHEEQLIWNKFTATAKYALYGTTANDGTTGLGFTDQNKIGASNNNIVAIDGGIAISSGGDADFSSNYNGNGNPLAYSGGAHYDEKFNKGKDLLNTNYKVSLLDVTGYQSILSQQTLPGFINNTNTLRNFNNSTLKQKIDAAYTITIDTTSSIKIAGDAALRRLHTVIETLTNTSDSTGTPLNRLNQRQDNLYNEQIFDFSAFYTKKLKRGRTFSWSVSESYDKNDQTNYQQSTSTYFRPGKPDSVALIDQYKPGSTIKSVLNSNMTFSTPIVKHLSLLFNYGFALNNSSSDQLSLNKDAAGNYTVVDPVYSSNYKFNQLTDQLGAVFNFKTAKITWNFGTKASDVQFTQTDEFTGNVYKRSFINWLPQSNFQYKISQNKNLSINYSGSSIQPTISQIQPIASNNNPLNILVGNPDLGPAFRHTFQANYSSSQLISQQSFYLYSYYTFTTNTIVSNITTNTLGQSTTQYINLVNANPHTMYLDANFSRKIFDVNFNFSVDISNTVGYSYTNGLLNKSNSTEYEAGLGFNKSSPKKFSSYLSLGPSYTFSNFSLQQGTNNNAAGLYGYFSGQLFLPGKFILSSDARENYAAATQSVPVESTFIWNASLAKTFLKDDNLKLSISGNNILNQNPTLQRSVSANMISQSYYNTVKRYLLFTVTYDFTKFGVNSTQPAKK